MGAYLSVLRLLRVLDVLIPRAFHRRLGLLNAGLIRQARDVLFTLSLCDSFFEHASAPKLASLAVFRLASGNRSDA
jgi:hypothetical protein